MPELHPGALTDVGDLEVGHATNEGALTGCTVVICRGGTIAGGSVRGLAPGTRETALLRPGTLVERVHAILLTGGSAFGLAAADGVMRYLEERGIGYDTGAAKVPIVPGAVLYDLAIGVADIRPDANMGYLACEGASADDVSQGNVGAGTGATVGKLYGMARATKGGLGTASVQAGKLVVGALVTVNAFGDVVAPDTGSILAGARDATGKGWADTARSMRALLVRTAMSFGHTVIGVVGTNARLDVAQASEVAAGAHDGIARVVRPSHTLYDGDTLFCLATCRQRANLALVMDMAAEAVARAIVNGVLAAQGAGGLPAARDIGESKADPL